MEDSKQLLRVRPRIRQSKSRVGGEGGKTFPRVFVGKFSDDFFAAREMKFTSAQMNGLEGFTQQLHFDAVGVFVVNRAMPPQRKIEIGAQLAIDPNE